MENFVPRENLPQKGIKIIDRKKFKTIKTGWKKRKYFLCECPYCGKKSWVEDYALTVQKTTLCKEHGWIQTLIDWASEGEFDHIQDAIFHYDKQGCLIRPGFKYPIKRVVAILIECPNCHKTKYSPVRDIRQGRKKGTRCPGCATGYRTNQIMHKKYSSGTGGISYNNGYICINKSKLKYLYTPEQVDLILKYLKPKIGGGMYLLEHRIVALLTFGPDAIKEGMVIRHIDGNKKNNSPENLTYGTPKENTNDHFSALRDMKMWRGMALILMDIIIKQKISL